MKFFVLHDQNLTPLFAYVAILNSLITHERQTGSLTVQASGSVSFGGADKVEIDDLFTGEAAISLAAAGITQSIGLAATNEFRPALAERLDLRLRVSEDQEAATIERAWLDTTQPRPGETHTLSVQLRSYRGAIETISMPIEMPAQASGPLTLLVSDAATLSGLEQRELKPAKPASWPALLAQMNSARRNNRLMRLRPAPRRGGGDTAGLSGFRPDGARRTRRSPPRRSPRRSSAPGSGASPARSADRASSASRCGRVRHSRLPFPDDPTPRAIRCSPVPGLGALGWPARASGPVFWTVATAADFLRGTSDGVFVSRDGVLTAGPQVTNRLTSTPAQIWSLAESTDGTLWAGTGGDGRLLRVRPGQAEETAFDAEESNIFAVAVSGTRVYAATSPDGRVYVLDGAAPARPFFDPQEKYIWALSAGPDGRLWVGAGNPAVIYRVDASGTGQAVYRPPAAHVVTLGRDSAGRLLAGTESPGRLYRLAGDDRPFVLLDAGMTELRATAATAAGVVFAAAVTRGDDPAPASANPRRSPSRNRPPLPQRRPLPLLLPRRAGPCSIASTPPAPGSRSGKRAT
jgi:hypothetical protein